MSKHGTYIPHHKKRINNPKPKADGERAVTEHTTSLNTGVQLSREINQTLGCRDKWRRSKTIHHFLTRSPRLGVPKIPHMKVFTAGVVPQQLPPSRRTDTAVLRCQALRR